MKTINHECYVDLEVAKLLEKAGFDWEGTAYYQHGVFYPYSVDRERLVVMNQSSAPSYMEQYSAPTLDVAQKWLREVKGIYIGIVALENKRSVTNSDGWTFHYEYGKPTFDCDIQNERCETISTLDNSFNTYEEAQEAGIKKALELILEKGE